MSTFELVFLQTDLLLEQRLNEQTSVPRWMTRMKNFLYGNAHRQSQKNYWTNIQWSCPTIQSPQKCSSTQVANSCSRKYAMDSHISPCLFLWKLQIWCKKIVGIMTFFSRTCSPTTPITHQKLNRRMGCLDHQLANLANWPGWLGMKPGRCGKFLICPFVTDPSTCICFIKRLIGIKHIVIATTDKQNLVLMHLLCPCSDSVPDATVIGCTYSSKSG